MKIVDSVQMPILKHDFTNHFQQWLPPLKSHLATLDRTPEEASSYYSLTPTSPIPTPDQLTNAVEAGELIASFIRNNRKILVFGDYDCDGITSTTIMVKALLKAGANVEYHLPNRNTDGYGLSPKLANDCYLASRPDLLITVDCGITAVESVDILNTYGVTVIITDHHKPEEVLPRALIVNPKVYNDTITTNLAGCGVSLMVSYATYMALGLPLSRLESLVQYAAIGTVADMMVLDEVNRTIVLKGLEGIREAPTVFGSWIKAEYKQRLPITSTDISFTIAPLINSAGRLSQADLALDMLLSTDVDTTLQLGEHLKDCNKKRKIATNILTKVIMEKIERELPPNPSIVILASEDWDPALLGIVASKVIDTYKVPTILLGYSSSGYSGSGRAPKGFDLHTCIATAGAGLLSKFGGHMYACGLSISRNNFVKFAGRVQQYIFSNPYTPDKTETVSGIVKVSDLSYALIAQMKQLEPFGISNPEPIWGLKDVELSNITYLSDTHTKGSIRDETGEIPFIVFNYILNAPTGVVIKCSVSGHVTTNTWRGETNLQFMLTAISNGESYDSK